MKVLDISISFTITVPDDVEINDATTLMIGDGVAYLRHKTGNIPLDLDGITPEVFGEYDDDE